MGRAEAGGQMRFVEWMAEGRLRMRRSWGCGQTRGRTRSVEKAAVQYCPLMASDLQYAATGDSAMAAETFTCDKKLLARILCGGVVLATALCATTVSQTHAQPGSFECPVTVVNGGKGGIYGNDALDVVLWLQSKFVFMPGGAGFVDSDGALGIKLGWERKKRGLLEIGGRRLDGEARSVRAYIYDYGDIGFQPIYLVFPTPGCWEVTGSVGDERLTFVVFIAKVGEGHRVQPTRARMASEHGGNSQVKWNLAW